MAYFPMDPYYEQRLREEVIYLHSLWHKGPPRISNHTSRPLQPSTSTHFKKQRKNPRFKNTQKIVSDIEWPVTSPADPLPTTSSGWPELKLRPNPMTRVPSLEEQARFHWNQVQQKALNAAKEFFSSNGDEDDGDESDEDEIMDGDETEDEEHKFFLKLFAEDNELKGYYEKNCGGGGELCCLVCGGIGEKFGKRFKDCIALVQHSVSIAKTKKRKAHRAYGKAICEILSWDINRLPSSIVSTLKSSESQGNAGDGEKDLNDSISNVGLMNCDNGVAVLEMDSNGKKVVADKAPEPLNPVDYELMVCENSLPVTDAIRNLEDSDKRDENPAQGNSEPEGPVISLCRNLSKRMVLEGVEMK